jgi:hypothetical protein
MLFFLFYRNTRLGNATGARRGLDRSQSMGLRMNQSGRQKIQLATEPHPA